MKFENERKEKKKNNLRFRSFEIKSLLSLIFNSQNINKKNAL